MLPPPKHKHHQRNQNDLQCDNTYDEPLRTPEQLTLPLILDKNNSNNQSLMGIAGATATP